MTYSSRTVVIFAVAFAILLMTPAFLNQQFGPYPLMKTGDVTDVITPMVLLPLYWLLFRLNKVPSTRETILFLIFAAFWVEGQGMHLSANSIGHLIASEPPNDQYTLTHFYDEVLSHYLWHIGMFGLAALMIWRQMQNIFTTSFALRAEAIAGVIYGVVNFVITIEANTVPLGLPAAVLLIIWGLSQRRQFRQQPLTAFLTIAHTITLVLYVIWYVRFGGFPEFSDLGLI